MTEKNLPPSDDGLHHRLQEARRWGLAWQAASKEATDIVARRLAGNQFDGFVSNRTTALSALEDSAYNIRYAALCILLEHWPPASQYTDLLFKLVGSDPAEEVRICALNYLADLFRGSDDSVVGKFVAKLVSDATQSEILRLEAYQSLLYIGKLRLFSLTDVRKNPSLDKVDWKYVESWLQK